jgi:hypothetical protein
MKAIAREPSDRWPTAALFVQALLSPMGMEGLQTVSIPGRALADLPPPAPVLGTKRLGLERAVLAALIVILAGVLVYDRRGRLFPAPEASIPAAAQASVPASPSPGVEAVLSAINRALDEGAYPEALQMSEVALRLDPANRAAQSLRERVVKAWDAEKSLGLWEGAPAPDEAEAVDRGASPR